MKESLGSVDDLWNSEIVLDGFCCREWSHWVTCSSWFLPVSITASSSCCTFPSIACMQEVEFSSKVNLQCSVNTANLPFFSKEELLLLSDASPGSMNIYFS